MYFTIGNPTIAYYSSRISLFVFNSTSGGFISAEEFDRVADPKKIIGDPRRDLGMPS
jgi:hypothetical protein